MAPWQHIAQEMPQIRGFHGIPTLHWESSQGGRKFPHIMFPSWFRVRFRGPGQFNSQLTLEFVTLSERKEGGRPGAFLF